MILFLYLCLCFIASNSQTIPYWSAPWPNATAPLGGYSFLPNRSNYQVFEGTLANGAYNHAAMIGYHYNVLTVLWKNCQITEDCNGQRILYSQSSDGKQWNTADIFFGNLTTPTMAATLFVGPPIIINGRQYVGASAGKHNTSNDQSAQGAQFCLYPQPLDPRNCGPASQQGKVGQENNTLLMREILSGMGNLGKMFWASSTAPIDFAEATKMFNIPTVNEMDQQTQNDIALLTKQMNGFCNGKNKENATLKCEVVENGILDYRTIDERLGIANELTHYTLPSNDGDVLLYRANSHEKRFYASMRNFTMNDNKKIFGNWTAVTLTNIPDVNANLNSRVLPNGKVMLLSNPVYNRAGRDPLTISTTSDGYNFDAVGVIMSCTDFSATSTCKARHSGNSDGPAYPQGITIVDPAEIARDLEGVWVVASNNKEDIWVTHVPFSAIP